MRDLYMYLWFKSWTVVHNYKLLYLNSYTCNELENVRSNAWKALVIENNCKEPNDWKKNFDAAKLAFETSRAAEDNIEKEVYFLQN